MRWKRQTNTGLSSVLLTALAVVGAIVLLRELPAMRRYVRISRM